MLREVARQGLLPYPRFFASTKPFGTPLAPVCLKYLLSVFAIVAIPAQDAFNFLVDLVSYPNLVGFLLNHRVLRDEQVPGFPCCNCYRVVASSEAANARWLCAFEVPREICFRFLLLSQRTISHYHALVWSF